MLTSQNKVVFVPTYVGYGQPSSIIGIFDAWTETFHQKKIPEELLNVGKRTELWANGVLVAQDIVVFVPYRNTGNGLHIGIFDAISHELKTKDITSRVPHEEGDAVFHGGVISCDGKVVFPPAGNGQTIGIFEVESDSFHGEDISSKIWNRGTYVGGVLLPSCRIVFVPASADNVGIFDPLTNDFETVEISSVLSGDRKFIGGVLTPGGHVIFSPHYDTSNGGHIGIFNTSDKSFRVVDISDKITTGFYGSVLLPNGNILHIPYSSGSIGMFDPSTESFHVEPWRSENEVRFGGGTLTQNGKVVMSPIVDSEVGVYDLADQKPGYKVASAVPESWKVLLSPYLNRH